MPITTPLDIITLALKNSGVVGVGQTPAAEDTNDAFNTMNLMIAEWNHQRWLIYHLINITKVSTGAASYTVATGGDFDTPRPDRLEFAILRQYPTAQQPVDQTLRILESMEDFQRITVKLTTGPAQYAFYDSAYPVGRVYFWPVTQASIYSHIITVKDQITEFTSLAQTINLPHVYRSALLYNLGVRLRPMYQLPEDPSLIKLAMNALGVVRGANAQIPRLRMPTAVMGRRGSYDIFSDSSRS